MKNLKLSIKNFLLKGKSIYLLFFTSYNIQKYGLSFAGTRQTLYRMTFYATLKNDAHNKLLLFAQKSTYLNSVTNW